MARTFKVLSALLTYPTPATDRSASRRWPKSCARKG